MRPILLLSLLLFFLENISAQPCVTSTDTAHLDVNNVRAILQASGDFFWDRSDAGYFVPKGDPNLPQTATIFAGGLWLGGLDVGGNLKIAAQTYGASSNSTDWWPGPLTLDEGISDTTNCYSFDHLWKINKSEIIAHIADFASDGDIDGPVPANILAWPGKDNPQSLSANNFSLPAGRDLAPFIDRNENAKYEPLLGDYPNVPGDQAIWWIFNDEGGGAIHGETGGIAIRAEVHTLAYAFEGSGDENLKNTTFYDFNIYNRAKEDLDSAFVTLFVDPDLGCYLDDFIGCIPTEKMAFIYNEDSQDGQPGCICPEVETYCEDIPVTGIKVLRGPKNEEGEDVGFSSFMYINNQIGDPIPATTDPVTDIEYYRYMNARWRDGSHLVDESPGGTGEPTSYVFPDNPADTEGWSLCNAGLMNHDRRMLINSGPFRLQPGESTSICYAVMTKFGIQYPCPDVTPLIEMGNAIEEFCASLTPTNEVHLADATVQFNPNPLISEGKLTANGATFEQVRLSNLDGRLVRQYNDLKTNELTIELGGLPAGFYLYSVLLDNGQLATGKIVAQ